jgi:subtilase family serine protease
MAALAAVALLAPAKANAEKMQMINPAEETRKVEFNVYLPLQHTDELDKLLEAQHNAGSGNYHKWLTPAQFDARYGPSAKDLAVLTQTLKSYSLNVVGTNSHGVHVRGTVGVVQKVLGTPLWNAVTSNGKSKIIAAQSLNLPLALQQIGARVVAFRSHELNSHARRVTAAISPENRVSPYGGYWFNDLKQAYDFPSYQSLNGSGRTIAIMSVSDYLDSDIAAYFAHESTTAAPIAVPNIIRAAQQNLWVNSGSGSRPKV